MLDGEFTALRGCGAPKRALTGSILVCCDRFLLCFDRFLLCFDRFLLCFDRFLLCFDRFLLCCDRFLVCLRPFSGVCPDLSVHKTSVHASNSASTISRRCNFNVLR
jgi:hypothetical protein